LNGDTKTRILVSTRLAEKGKFYNQNRKKGRGRGEEVVQGKRQEGGKTRKKIQAFIRFTIAPPGTCEGEAETKGS